MSWEHQHFLCKWHFRVFNDMHHVTFGLDCEGLKKYSNYIVWWEHFFFWQWPSTGPKLLRHCKCWNMHTAIMSASANHTAAACTAHAMRNFCGAVCTHYNDNQWAEPAFSVRLALWREKRGVGLLEDFALWSPLCLLQQLVRINSAVIHLHFAFFRIWIRGVWDKWGIIF